MIIVTGGAGLVGSNIVRTLNEKGHTNILVVDDLSDGTKFNNLIDNQIIDYLDKEDLLHKISENIPFPEKIEAIFHDGACTDTTEWDGCYMMDNNYEYSKILLNYAQDHKIPFIYASSAAVYGGSTNFSEDPANERPLNVYGYSKLLFDQYVRRILPNAQSQIVGLRYFNIYGPHEQHKGAMASMAYQLNNQFANNGTLRLFQGVDGYADGEQRRDFVYVGDVAAVNVWFWQNPSNSGIYNLGTGRSQTFNDVANAIVGWYKSGSIEYIPFPDHLRGRYQSFTEANVTKLRSSGYDQPFKSVEEGMQLYLDWLNNKT